jgi:uncharacterized protein YbcV (DUF1398 family)
MAPSTKTIIEQSVADCYAGRSNFGQHVAHVAQLGVESYRVDYRQRSSTYFLVTDEHHTVEVECPSVTIPQAFDAAAVIASIRGAQQGAVKYPEFLERTMRAGCVGYVVWIAGRHVVYFGRHGETHVERFPGT